MRSTVLDRRPGAADAGATDLLVLWQHPGTRQIHAIGRLSHVADRFSFAYTRSAAEIEDFRPLLGLGDLYRRYNSGGLPAVFGQRVMGRERPDYTSYVEGLGLDPDAATPWEQIVHSGGQRHGDTLQFIALPRVEHGRARARFFVSGVRHMPDEPRVIESGALSPSHPEHEAALSSMRAGDTVLFRAEAGNPEDPNAILVMAGDTPIGWVPRILASSIRDLMASGPVSAIVDRVAPPNTAPHTRVVLDLDAPATPGFEFDREQRWVPLPQSVARRSQ